MEKRVLNLEKKINIKFKNKNLILQALTHTSYVNEHPALKRNHNERLEFLGDAVLEFVITNYLYKKFPEHPEGKLTVLRSSLVNTESLSNVAKKINLEKYIFLSKGEKISQTKPTILANIIEALIGAIFLDQGIEKSTEFIKQFIISKLKTIIQTKSYKNAKGQLQEITQSKIKVTPTYKIISESGPEHKKIFKVGVFINKKKIATGKGKSKQKAEIRAAQKALKKMN
ncbi:MAG TPA: ribonuclease III [Patescibacteria group bacterium]|nr:ribonuclease III [Patescibacteria group bacterium]